MSYSLSRGGILLPSVQFAEDSSRAKVILDEIATTSDGKDITLGYIDGLSLLPNNDPIIKARGYDISIYEKVRSDDQVQTAFQQRRLALTSKEWEVIPASLSRKDKAAADFITEQVTNLQFDRITEKMLSGLFWGYAVSECLWARDGQYISIADIKVKKQRRFGFAPDGSLRLLTTKNMLGEALPERKFWTYTAGTDDDDSFYGQGLAHWLYWPVFFKRNGIKFWLIFLEKFGMPTALGKYPSGALAEDKDALLDALSAIQSDSGVRIPDTMAIELIEAARSGTADYTSLYDRMDAAITKVILGHTGSTESTAGKLGGENMAEQIRDDLVAADGDLICSSFNQSVVKWLVDWNFPGAGYPKVWRQVGGDEDLKLRSERDKNIFDMGYRPTLKYIQDHYDADFEQIPTQNNPSENPTSQPGQADKPAQFAEEDIHITPTNDYTAQLAKTAAPAIDEWLAIIKAKVQAAQSLAELRDDLIASYADLPSEKLIEVMSLAYATANLAGQFAVSNDK